MQCHGKQKKNIYSLYTKENEKEIKIGHYKNQLNTKKAVMEETKDKKL